MAIIQYSAVSCRRFNSSFTKTSFIENPTLTLSVRLRTVQHKEAEEDYDRAKLKLNKVADFQEDGAGSVLGLWLMGVLISHEQPLAGQLTLKKNPITTAKVAQTVLRAMGIGFDYADLDSFKLNDRPPVVGGAYPVPRLYSHQALSMADLACVVRWPYQVDRSIVSGGKSHPGLPCPDLHEEPGESLYFLPIVVRHPKGKGCEIPPPATALGATIQNWVSQSLDLGEGDQFTTLSHLLPYSVAMEVAAEWEDGA